MVEMLLEIVGQLFLAALGSWRKSGFALLFAGPLIWLCGVPCYLALLPSILGVFVLSRSRDAD